MNFIIKLYLNAKHFLWNENYNYIQKSLRNMSSINYWKCTNYLIVVMLKYCRNYSYINIITAKFA